MINVLFFAALREQLSCEKISISAENIDTIEDVISCLISQSPQWHKALSASLLYAVNQNMVCKSHRVSSGDEVALFPPVTGG